MRKLGTKSKQTGDIGENIAARYLRDNGYVIETRNYRRKFGEIDIIASDKEKTLVFVEVKTMETTEVPKRIGVGSEETFMPEYQMHPQKCLRLYRAIRAYLADFYPEEEPVWRCDLIALRLDSEKKKAYLRQIEGVELV